MKTELTRTICDNCRAPIGVGIEGGHSGLEHIEMDVVVFNEHVRLLKYPGVEKEPHLRAHIDFCNRRCCREWMLANMV